MVATLAKCLWLLLQVGLAFTESGNILRRHQDRTSRSAEAEKLLATRAAELAAALKAEYGDFGSPSVVDVIRGRLAQEASDLASEDSEGASLFSAFSQRAPVEVLIVPQRSVGGFLLTPFDNHVGMDEGIDDTRVIGSTMSSESIMKSDGNGNVVVQTRRCKDGQCMQTSKEVSGKPPDASEMLPTADREKSNVFMDDQSVRHNISIDSMSKSSSFEKQQDTFMGMDDASSSVTDAVRRMAQDMQHIQDTFGDGALNAMFDNVFSPSSEASNKSNMVGRSYSERTVVNNGHVFREIRRCENGKCSIERDETSEARTPASQHEEQKQPKHTMPF